MDLFSNIPKSFEIANCKIELQENFLSKETADRLFSSLLELDWKQEYINIMGKTHPIPRLTYWFSKENKSYVYSGIRVDPVPFSEEIEFICSKIEAAYNKKFNSVLLNLYRDGKDSVAWHSDDEASLGSNINVASYSLGESRKFQLRENKPGSEIHSISLQHNSLLFMHHPTQERLIHQIPKSTSSSEPRINLTFRYIS